VWYGEGLEEGGKKDLQSKFGGNILSHLENFLYIGLILLEIERQNKQRLSHCLNQKLGLLKMVMR